jgi:hypothetical protein
MGLKAERFDARANGANLFFRSVCLHHYQHRAFSPALRRIDTESAG